MSNQDEFFTPEEVDRQIDQVSRLKEGGRTDAEVMAYLRSLYGIDARQEQKMLDRIWNRIANAAPPLQHNLPQKLERAEVIAMQNQPAQFGNPTLHKRHSTLIQRLGMLAAAVFLVALVGSMALVFYSIRHNAGGPANGGPNPTAIVTTAPLTPTHTTTSPFKVTSVDMSVAPASIAGIPCGTNVTETYEATIHVAANSPGGTVHFNYTINNGRSQNTASVTFAPGETSKTYSFTWSGALPADHTSPGLGAIQVTSPNQLISPTVKPAGTCVAPSAFTVTRVDMAVSPTSIQGLACGTSIVVTYTAAIHVAANSPGGTVHFNYTINNGRGQNIASVTFAPGEASKTYSFTWSGALPVDHTYPGPGGIQVTSPNQLISPMVKPTGTCVAASAFVVTRVDMAVSPTSIQGLACGTSIVVTYTATIHVAANSPGGTVHFNYTINNGRSQNIASVTFAAGETSKTYSFTWSGALPVDHTYPGLGAIQVTSPNQLISPMVKPAGTCK